MSDKNSFINAISKNDLQELIQLLRNLRNIGDANYSIPSEGSRTNENNYRNRRNDEGREQEDSIPSTGLTLLHIAAYYDSLECFRYLEVQCKLGLRRPSANGFLPLHYACWSGAHEVALYILTKEPSQSTSHPEGINDLHLLYCATIGCDAEILETLFNNGAKMSDPWNNEKKLIEKGIGLHNKAILTLLLKKATQKGRDTSQMTVSMKAVIFHNAEALAAIYNGKDDILAHYIDSTGFHSLISLICETDQKNKTFKQVLIKILNDAQNLKIEPPKTGSLQYQSGVCHWACMYMDLDVAKLMFQTQDVDPNRFDKEYKTGPVRLIEKTGKIVIEMLDFILTRTSFNIDIRYNDKSPTLLESFMTAIKPNYEAIEYLVNAGANTKVKHSRTNMTLYDYVRSRSDKKMKKIFQIQ